jgi:hypothetical protein
MSRGAAAGVIDGAFNDIKDELPNIDTRSSSGLADVPDRMFFAAGCCSTCVAASPVGSSDAGSSSKSSRFSDACPAATVWSAAFADVARLQARTLSELKMSPEAGRNSLGPFALHCFGADSSLAYECFGGLLIYAR